MPDVYLFTSQRDRAATAKLRDSYGALCRERSWNFQPKALDPIRASSGRPVLPVSPAVAAGLYPRVHRQRVAILVFGTDPVVPLLPNQADAIRRRRTIPLRQFLDYKSCWIRVPKNDPTNLSWAGIFESWCRRADCEGEHDPRCLPFHVFSSRIGAGLEDDSRRREFNEYHGAGSTRVDDKELQWLLEPRDFHSEEVLSVAGYSCRPGFHWDVTGSKWCIETPAGIWKGSGHVNVYPDAHIRTKGNNVRKVV